MKFNLNESKNKINLNDVLKFYGDFETDQQKMKAYNEGLTYN